MDGHEVICLLDQESFIVEIRSNFNHGPGLGPVNRFLYRSAKLRHFRVTHILVHNQLLLRRV